MSAAVPATRSSSTQTPLRSGSLCPFHDGAATLDLLLAELDPREVALFDAALDLRSLAAARANAAACVAQLLRVRQLLDGRHYVPFYRVRCWARQALRIEVRTTLRGPWHTLPLPLNCARVDEVVNSAVAACTPGTTPAALLHVRFAFAP